MTCGFTHLFMILNCVLFTSLAMPILSLMLLVIGTLIFSLAPPSMRLLLLIMTPSNVYGNHLSIWLQVSPTATFNSASPGFKPSHFLTLPNVIITLFGTLTRNSASFTPSLHFQPLHQPSLPSLPCSVFP